MKQLIIFLLFTIGISAQIKMEKGNNLFWADSLWGVSDTLFVVDSVFRTADTVVTIDTVVGNTTSELEVNGLFDWMNITVEDTGTAYKDSCILEYGVYKLHKSSDVPSQTTVYDTIWQRVQYMRDSTWTNTNLVPDSAQIRSYRANIADYDLIRVRMMNVQPINNRLFRFYAILTRKK